MGFHQKAIESCIFIYILFYQSNLSNKREYNILTLFDILVESFFFLIVKKKDVCFIHNPVSNTVISKVDKIIDDYLKEFRIFG